LVNIDNVPVYFVWLPYISFIKWAFQALVLNEVCSQYHLRLSLTLVDQFTGITFTCEESDMIFGRCRYEKGEDVIDAFGLDGDITVSAVVLLGMILLLRILAFLVLLLKVRKSNESSA
jgi:hypothetical protein